MNHDTEGSDFIKTSLLDDDSSPVYLQIWGGTNTVARALKSIEDQYKNTPDWPAIAKKVSDKAIIYAVLDQDNTYQTYVAPTGRRLKSCTIRSVLEFCVPVAPGRARRIADLPKWELVCRKHQV